MEIDGPGQPEPDPETRLDEFWTSWRDSGTGPVRFVLGHPRRALRAVRDVLALPWLEARLADTRDGRLIRDDLTRRCLVWFSLAATGACVLPVPADPSAYREGARKQTLRRKIRAAERAGVTWRPVPDRAEQVDLAGRLDRALTVKADVRYRQFGKDHAQMAGQGLWSVAEGPDGEPLVLAVTPYDGEWALLRVFITLGEGRQHSDARYLLTAAVVEQLSERGVRHLLDGRGLHELTDGLRHFQRMLGFRVARVRIRGRDARAGALPAPGPEAVDRADTMPVTEERTA
ncbi:MULTISPECIES: hypothetical protein [unclassified Blastococcus]